MDRLSKINDLLPAGPPLPEALQIGRAAVISAVEQRLRAKEVLLMMEGRRTGKTSVAGAALDRIQTANGAVGAVTLTRFKSDREVARWLQPQLAPTSRRALGSIAALLRRADRTSLAELSGNQAAQDVAAAADLIQSATGTTNDLAQLLLGNRDTRPAAILLDEAHAILEWSSSSQSSLNAALRGQVQLGVVLTSSDSDALDALTTKGGPLYLVGSRLSLAPIETAEWFGALRDRFAELEIVIGEATLHELISETRGHPYLTMRLSRDIARIASDAERPWTASAPVLEAGLFEARRDPVWTALHGSTDD